MSVHATFRRLMSRAAQIRRCPQALFSISAILLSGLLMSVPVRATELDVPGTFPSIKAAIAAASSGDVIVVAPGTYIESPTASTPANPTYQDYDISMDKGLNITIKSSGGPGVTTLDYTNAGEVNVVTYQNSGQTPSSIFSGFTILNDNSPSGAIEMVDCGVTIQNCRFVGCTSVSTGGGVDVLNSGSGIGIKPTISGCRFENCQAGDTSTTSGFGGAIDAFDEASGGSTTLTITNCQFTGNVATYDGAAIDVLGASGSPAVTVANCSFTGNVAKGFIDSTFSGVLTSPSASATVGAVDVFGGTLTLVNSVLWADAGATVVTSVNSNEISTLDPGATAQNCDIQQTGFSPNINTNPLYIGAASANLEVPYNSPLINVGASTFGSPNIVPAIDLNGVARTSPPDIGAYEYGLASSGLSFGAVPGVSSSPTTATFDDSVGDTTPIIVSLSAKLSATIAWGDGTTSAGAITQPGGSGHTYQVSGTHTYVTSGSYTVTTTITAATNAPVETTSATSTATLIGIPTANSQLVSVTHNTAKSITLTASDPDTPPLSLTYATVASPTHGTLTGTAPNLTYTPNANFQGADSFTFNANNGTHVSPPATVNIVVTPGTPTANGQSVSVAFNTAKGITLTGSDPDVPALSLIYTIGTSPTHGALSGTAPNLTYTPNSNFHGADSFTFTVNNGTNTSSAATVSINVSTGIPIANAQSVSVAFNTAKSITLTGSDPDVPALSLTYAIGTSPAHGALSGTAPNLTYTPNAGYSGADSFTFTVSNGTNTSSAATVSINVGAGTPTANPQSVPVTFNTARGITLTGSDPDVPALSLTYAVGSGPAHGTLSGTAPNLTYTPNSNFHGSDSFTFTVNNGTNTSSAATVSINVGVGTPTANAQSANVAFNTAKSITLTGSDPDVPALSLFYAVGIGPLHGTLSGTAPNLTYTPNSGYHGSDSFTFTVNNGTNTSTAATVSLTVATGTPTANSQSVSTNENVAAAVTLTGSDPDVPALTLSYTVATPPAHGALSGTAPNLTYTPSAGYTGPDSFTFTVNNGTNTSAPATVSITVNGLAADVSGQVTVTRGGYRLIPGSTNIAQTVTLKNTGSAITGPISLVLTGLSSNATLSNATGTTSAVAPSGRPYINVSGLAAGASETVGLLFSDPTKTGITYTTQVLGGPGLR